MIEVFGFLLIAIGVLFCVALAIAGALIVILAIAWPLGLIVKAFQMSRQD